MSGRELDGYRPPRQHLPSTVTAEMHLGAKTILNRGSNVVIHSALLTDVHSVEDQRHHQCVDLHMANLPLNICCVMSWDIGPATPTEAFT